jgi:GalNAc-alpha-(1->4)-GalNAc-alpha-(1->3)-diNAcBac-PP-undecaprenol alpha-1,4-N-acetyl-D-galactosaminyltransferase
MNIALVIASLGAGGAERVMSELANHFAERGDRVTLITLDTIALDAYPLAPGIERVALGLVKDSTGIAGALAMNWRRLRAVRRAIRRTGARTVLSFEERTNVLVVVATLGLPLRRVVSERTDPTRHEIGAVWELMRRLTYPFADAVVVQTARLLPWARRTALRPGAAHAIPNPLRALKQCGPAPAARETMIAALGRLWLEKGHDVLIRAFAAVAPDYPEWRLTIVGEGPERAALTALTASLGVAERVEMPGWMDVPEEVLARAAVFVMSSRYEGFPNALLEAMGAGLPVISTACGGTEEMIEEGRNGYIVPIDDVDALAAALRRLLGDRGLRERLAADAYVAALRYSPRHVVPMWDAVLRSPCGAKSATKSYSSSAR